MLLLACRQRERDKEREGEGQRARQSQCPTRTKSSRTSAKPNRHTHTHETPHPSQPCATQDQTKPNSVGGQCHNTVTNNTERQPVHPTHTPATRSHISSLVNVFRESQCNFCSGIPTWLQCFIARCTLINASSCNLRLLRGAAPPTQSEVLFQIGDR